MCVIVALGAEDAVDPAVFVGGQTHIVDICRGNDVLRQGDGAFPEAESIDAVRRFGNREEGFPVGAFDANAQQIFAIPADGAGIHRRIGRDSFAQVRICLFGQIVAPFDGDMFGGQNGIPVAAENAVIGPDGKIGGCEQFFLPVKEIEKTGAKSVCHNVELRGKKTRNREKGRKKRNLATSLFR